MKYLIFLCLGILTSFYIFPVEFTFFPGINTKILLAVIGCLFFLFNALRIKEIKISQKLVGAIAISFIFSFSCLLSCEFNNTYDYSYVTYFISFFTWLMGAYGLCELIRFYHGKSTIRNVTFYLAAVGIFQCIMALLIDTYPSVKNAVNSIFANDVEFYEGIDRLYGIGASLDTAGVRFSIMLILIVHLFHTEQLKKYQIYFLWISFSIIVIIGNMIARTTTIGALLAIGYFFYRSMVSQKKPFVNYTKIYVVFFFLIIISIGASVYLYNHNEVFYSNIRFAFEGFFNWIEHGEWRTGSTDKLNAVMWIWPNNIHEWIWGTGLFGNYIYSTDIGYCRFILYCGVVGFSIFVFFFGYNSFALYSLKKIDAYLALLFFALTLIIWIKVATDIFFIYAVLYCLDDVDFSLLGDSQQEVVQIK